MKDQQPKTKKRRDVVTGVAMPQPMLDALDELAERSQIFSRSPLIRIAVKEFLERQNANQLKEAA